MTMLKGIHHVAYRCKDAKETVPLGTPVLGSDPDSGEDSCEVSCEGAEEPVRRTLFPYW